MMAFGAWDAIAVQTAYLLEPYRSEKSKRGIDPRMLHPLEHHDTEIDDADVIRDGSQLQAWFGVKTDG